MNAQVDLLLKAVNTSSGRVFASRTAHGTGNHINKSTARLEAIKSACQSAIRGYSGEEEGIITQIIRKWTQNVHITLIISGLKSDTQLISLETAIKSNIRGVQSLIRRNFNLEKGEAQLEIVSSLDAQSTMTDLTQKDLGIKITVTSFAGDRIEIKVQE
jgi:hypothetical protein